MSQDRYCKNCKWRVEKKCTSKESGREGKWMARKSAACEQFKVKK